MTKDLELTRRGLLTAGGMALVGAALANAAEGAWTAKAWGPTEKANAKSVGDLFAAMESGSMDRVVPCFADDAKVRFQAHTPAAPVNPEGIRKTLGNFLKPGAIRFKVLDTVAQGPMVINTRIDR